MALDSLGTNPFPNYLEKKKNPKPAVYCTCRRRVQIVNFIFQYNYEMAIHKFKIQRHLHFSNDCSQVIGVLGGIFILNHTSHSIICQSRIPHSEM